jgi:bifunctional non-homologous end joining protein LigD
MTRVEITRPGKKLFPELTKRELVDYYLSVAPMMLGYLRDRPVTMFRYPDGIDGKQWVQKDMPSHFPEWIERVEVPKEGGTVTHVLCHKADTLAYLANQACITPHIWLSRADRPDHPDRLIFDLDPSKDNFRLVREAAFALRALLEEVGLASLPMTTGSRGLHVVVKLDRRDNFDGVRDFARAVSAVLETRHPKLVTAEVRKAKRDGRLYLDIARNGYAQTVVAPFAVRARPGAPVAAPITWEQLDDAKLNARTYTVRKPPPHDAWEGLKGRGRSLGAARKRLAALT